MVTFVVVGQTEAKDLSLELHRLPTANEASVIAFHSLQVEAKACLLAIFETHPMSGTQGRQTNMHNSR